MSGYIGNIPTPQATQTRDVFTATSGQTSFATSGYTPGFLDVYLNGVHLVNGTDYTASNGSDVVLSSGATAGDNLEVVSYSTFEVFGQTFTGNSTFTGDVLIADKIVHDGDTNTAIRFPAADTVTVETAGSERVRVDASGRVGIGTSSPTQPLSIRNADAAYLDVAGGNRTLGTNSFTFGQASDGVVAFFQRENAAMYWATNSTERMRINSSGHLIVPAGVTLGTSAGVYNAANTLDDYEEGTFTPQIGGVNAVNASAVYVKVGGLVHINMDVTAAAGITATNEISNLPFVVVAGYHSAFTVGYTNSGVEGGYFNAGGANMFCTTAGGTTAANISAGQRIILAGTYYTSA